MVAYGQQDCDQAYCCSVFPCYFRVRHAPKGVSLAISFSPAPSSPAPLPPSCCQRDRTFWHFGHQERPRLNHLRDVTVRLGWIA